MTNPRSQLYLRGQISSQLLLFFFLAPVILCSAAVAQSPPASAKFDGPAELPRIYLHSSLADTPAPGNTQLVKSGDDLQAALNHASCGDTLRLEAGATFSGIFHLSNKSCDDSHWIILRTSAPDSDLPAEGTRLTPCYAGVASLPARPDFHCSSPRNVLAKIVYTGKGASGPIFLDAGANHYRLTGLEITRAVPGATVHNLITPAARTPTDHLVFDRLWIHGTAQDETTRGIYISAATYVSVVDSYFSDFHCVAIAGNCTDAQAIGGGGGDSGGGPYKIVNNFLEAAGEAILFGGGPATTTPADMEIRRNHLYKPITWMPDQPGFVGGTSGKPFIVKNIFELKNAQRVLFEGNILEYTWGGFSQQGFAIALTPKNQAPNVCPLCRVTDITLRYNRVSHMAGGIIIADVPSGTGGPSTAGERISVHDMVFDDIDGTVYKGFGMFALIMSKVPKLHDVWLDHITAFPPRVMFGVGGNAGETKIMNFVFRNSIVSAGERQLTTTGGGLTNCASGQSQPVTLLDNCFQDIKFTHDVVVGAVGAWPKENFFPGSFSDVGFVNFNKGNGGDYRLCQAPKQPASCKAASKYAKAGSDGKDLGADIDAIEAATAGVQ
jgi:hypothetical protein